MILTKILAWAQNHKTMVYLLGALPILAILIYGLASHFLQPFSYSTAIRFQLILTPLAELLFAFFLLNMYQRYHQQTNTSLGWQLAFVFTLVNLLVVYFLRQYFFAYAEQGVLSARIAISASLVIFIILIVTALVSIWKSTKGSLVDDWMNISFTLPGRHPRERQISIIFLVICFLIGSGIRFYNLGGFPPYIDEYIHTHDAFEMINNIPAVNDRAFLTVSFPVYLSYLVFGVNLLSGRIPMVLINMLAIFPLFRLCRKVNRPIGYISVILYILSPWIVAVSRTVRDYAVVPLFFYTAVLLLVELLDWEGKNIFQYLKKYAIHLLAAALILGYAIYDFKSILKIIYAPYAIFGALVILKIIKHKGRLWAKYIIIGVGSIILLLIAWQSGLLFRYQLRGTFFNTYAQTYWDSVIQSGIHQWYWWGPLGLIIILLGGTLAIRTIFKPYNRENFIVLGAFLTFASVLFYLTFLFINPMVPERLRYGILLVYWYLPVVAVVIWVLYHWLIKLIPKIHPLIIYTLLAVIFTNPQSVWKVISYQGGNHQRVTGEKHYIVEPAYELLVEEMTAEDVLLTDAIHRWDEIAGGRLSTLEEISYYGYVVGEGNSPLTVIENFPRGWIAVTPNARPARFGLPEADFEHAGISVHYIGREGEIYLWQWGTRDE